MIFVEHDVMCHCFYSFSWGMFMYETSHNPSLKEIRGEFGVKKQ